MIAARLNKGFVAVFESYVTWLLRRSFRGVWLPRNARPFPSGGFIAVANHTSWWDGFVPFAVQRHLQPETPFYVMMDESQLRRFPFFRWGGAFSVNASSARRARESIVYACSIARAGAGVWIFPEGRIEPPGAEIRFTSGYLHVARDAGVPILPVALRYAMLEAQRPDAFFECAAPLEANARARELVPAIVARMRGDLSRALDRGAAFKDRSNLFTPGAGIDDAVSAVTARFGRRFS